ncbi:hypothetical protein CKAN_02257200 [Cinnamomum micranthum f. kanehirae]|uniref:Uncharacterized protein n=1 Tax=Cinnamomum micranthum f. kanehirae TaxID=337451 RepID=A0A3S3N051_9MAGN|nr:hypothetical protein CKAN_02257200 [Cinnamomum micranthum f. kanehirae]
MPEQYRPPNLNCGGVGAVAMGDPSEKDDAADSGQMLRCNDGEGGESREREMLMGRENRATPSARAIERDERSGDFSSLEHLQKRKKKKEEDKRCALLLFGGRTTKKKKGRCAAAFARFFKIVDEGKPEEENDLGG